MPSIANLQATALCGIMEGSKKVLPRALQPAHESIERASEIDPDHLRMTNFLADDYEKLRTYVGEVRFNAMAEAYTAASPSRHANARWFGQGLPAWLKQSAHFAQHPECTELAELELALATAFDAVDVPSLNIELLAALRPEQIANTAFAFHPSLQTLSFAQNTVSLWSALQCEEQPPRPFIRDGAQTVMVWRQGNQSRFRILGDEEALVLARAREAVPFGSLYKMMAKNQDSDDNVPRAVTYLRGWFEAQILTSFLPER
jgi:Putative DNA-binding domain